MIKRILVILSIFVPVLVAGAPSAQHARADASAQEIRAINAVNYLINDYSSGEFQHAASPACTGTETTGTCYWWGAVALDALITYAENHYCSGSGCPTTNGDIRSDVYTTYWLFCGNADPGKCPSGKNDMSYGGTDAPFTENGHGNAWFDDLGYWTQTWINAYQWTKQDRYLNLAEGIWAYTTKIGWFRSCQGLVQYVNNVDTTSSPVGTYDAYANSLYLRNSALLYEITLDSRYMTGFDFGDGKGQRGGAIRADTFVEKYLVQNYPGTPQVGTTGARFLIRDHVGIVNDSGANCADTTGDTQPWLASQGEMVSAWVDFSQAVSDYCGSTCSPGFWGRAADELAHTVVSEQLEYPAGSVSPNLWPYRGQPGLTVEPTVDHEGILSEPCEVDNTPDDYQWPHGCNTGGYEDFLIFKGLFMQGAYCLSDPTLATFISTNADSIADLTNIGFLWDDDGANTPINVGTVTSALDGLQAGTGHSTSMC